MYQYFQPNEKDKKGNASDCVVRALCFATNRSWEDVYTELCKIGLKKHRMPNNKLVYNQFLKNHGFLYQGIKIEAGTPRDTVTKFSSNHNDGKFIYILRCAHHIVASTQGNYFDSWDSGLRSVYAYWYKPSK